MLQRPLPHHWPNMNKNGIFGCLIRKKCEATNLEFGYCTALITVLQNKTSNLSNLFKKKKKEQNR